jgi:hypothetical protein
VIALLLVLAAEPPAALNALHARAVELEQTTAAPNAVESYFALLDGAVAAGSDAAALAAVDALVTRPVESLDALGRVNALAYRTPPGPVLARLERSYAGASPLIRATIARAARELALYAGDAAAAALWRQRAGCVREAAVVGPLAWPPLPAVSRATPLERTEQPLEGAYPGVPPFSSSVAVRRVAADDCDLELHTTSNLDGLRAVAVDVDVPRAQRLELELESRSAAAVVVGGRPVFTRGYELGGGLVRVRGWANVGAGKVRVVVRVGWNGELPRIRLAVLGEGGVPLATHAPRPGDKATVTATAAGSFPPSAGDRSLRAAAYLALGDARSAEHLLEEEGEPSEPLPSLLYARALLAARDRPEPRAVERSRQAYAAVLRAWPRSWEAQLGLAMAAVKQHGPVPGHFEALAQLAGATDPDPAVLAARASLADRAQLHDLADDAYTALAGRVPGTPLLQRVDRAVHDRVGAELEAFLCGGGDRDGLACLDTRAARGDRQGALAEIARLRTLRASPGALLNRELEQRLALGQRPLALAVYEKMMPALRPLAALGGLLDARVLRPRVLRELTSAPDAPAAAAALLAGQDSPAPALEAETVRRVAEDRRDRGTAGAATLVLVHRESYALAPSGLLRFTVYDVRRMSGTSDVNRPSQAAGPTIHGRDVERSLRRRIFKPDGRILDPEQSVTTSQGRTDLSQLEPGDYLEEIAEGWALPAAWGQLNVLTPDLFPERTSVADATIEIRRPTALPISLWAHPRLGKVTVTHQGKDEISTFTVHAAPPRRMESDVHWTERSVSVAFGTARWEQIGQALAQTVAGLADADPFLSRWAHAATRGSERDSRDLLDRVATAVGQSIKRPDPTALADWAAFTAVGSQRSNARSILELGEGSRTWVAYRALAELGVRADLAVAELYPFSADPKYPPRPGRFAQPLLVAHLPSGDVWMDLDVKGPPLPPGQVSPQLRGRQALTPEGPTVAVLEEATDNQVDEVNVTLRLDPQGTARGTATVALRGADAQVIADELETLVGLRRDRRLRSVILGWLPSATVNQVSLASEPGAWQVTIKADVELPGYAQAEGGGWALPGLPPVHALAAQPATLGSAFGRQRSRDSALTVEQAIQYRMRRRVTLPARCRVVGTAPALVVRDPNIEAFRGVELAGEIVDERYELTVPTAVVDPGRYEGLVKTLTQVDDVFQSATRVSVEKRQRP